MTQEQKPTYPQALEALDNVKTTPEYEEALQALEDAADRGLEALRKARELQTVPLEGEGQRVGFFAGGLVVGNEVSIGAPSLNQELPSWESSGPRDTPEL